tara:strand:+ start:189 stop:413 length:225 start_codon:yes stop_codon:yes gene_type:complete
MKRIIILAVLTLVGCADKEEWVCVTTGDTMFSKSQTGKFGSADKGCSCDEIRQFELRTFGEVDEVALKSDFGCE